MTSKDTDRTGDGGEICRVALDRYNRYLEREQENIDAAYDDLAFVYDDKQWHDGDYKARSDEGRPCLTINRLPQFVRQVTGDMRLMKPSIKVVPVDNKGDKETAETIGGMIRYIENRSDASAPYMDGAESQVAAGVGHWRVTKEYAAESTFNQELRILSVSDQVAIAWDADSILPTREDAKWCIVPVDMSRDAFKEAYPEASLEDFTDLPSPPVGWYDNDFVRVAEYWVKKSVKRTLALLPDGSIDDLTGEDESRLAELRERFPNVRVERRDGFKVCRYLITAAHVLEGPIDWPGMYIPIVPVLGEEKRIGRKIVRRGLIRSAKDSQRMFNYFCSAHSEVVALQPKAPFIGTEKNFEKYLQEWSEANRKAYSFLPYQPDPANGGQPPQRVPPPVSSQGITEGITLSLENMKGTIGIYDAGLGNKSNETSGKAILARQREGDIGTAVYIDNWIRAIRHTGKILVDLIPHVYDTERMIRIMGDDGKVDLKWINRATGMVQMGDDGSMGTAEKIENDVTTGAYDVVMDTGPSYTTKREEAKESMRDFMQSAPDVAPVIMDLFAKAQDWPLADEIGQRLEAIAPEPVKKLIAQQKKESGEEDAPNEPTPGEQMQAQAQQAALQLELENKALSNEKLKAEIAKIGSEIGGQDGQQKLAIEVQRAALDMEIKQRELAHKERMAELEYQSKLADIEIKRAVGAQQIMQRQAEQEMGEEAHRSSLAHSAQSHAAKMAQMSQKPEARA